jgi:hypothetical protein
MDFTDEELRLLSELTRGEQTISGNRDRSGLRRLVAAGYVTETSLNLSVTSYVLTPQGMEALKSIK